MIHLKERYCAVSFSAWFESLLNFSSNLAWLFRVLNHGYVDDQTHGFILKWHVCRVGKYVRASNVENVNVKYRLAVCRA